MNGLFDGDDPIHTDDLLMKQWVIDHRSIGLEYWVDKLAQEIKNNKTQNPEIEACFKSIYSLLKDIMGHSQAIKEARHKELGITND